MTRKPVISEKLWPKGDENGIGGLFDLLGAVLESYRIGRLGKMVVGSTLVTAVDEPMLQVIRDAAAYSPMMVGGVLVAHDGNDALDVAQFPGVGEETRVTRMNEG